MAIPSSQTLVEGSHGNEEQKELPDSQKSQSPPDDIDSHYSGTPVKFLPLCHVYSATSACVSASGSSNVVSKKVRARKLALIETTLEEERTGEVEDQNTNGSDSPQVIKVYSRRREKKPLFNSLVEKFEGEEPQLAKEALELPVKSEPVDEGFVVGDKLCFSNKKRRVGSSELVKLGVNSNVLCSLNGRRLRESRFQYNVGKNRLGSGKRKKRSSSVDLSNQDDWRAKKWFQYVLPLEVTLVYWPLDNAWYKASVISYDLESKRHSLKYEDGDEEELMVSDEQIKFHISKDEMKKLNLRGNTCMNGDDPDYSQLIGLAATVDESRELEPGDIIWAKLTVAVNDRLFPLKSISYAGLIVGFLASEFLISKQITIVLFSYLNEQKLPKSMLNMQRACEDVQIIDSDETSQKDGVITVAPKFRRVNFPKHVVQCVTEDLSNVAVSTKLSAHKLLSERYQNMPNGYRPVRIDWKDLDRCNVCHMDEEYENNLFLQCDKCRMMVHARCYGEEFVEGVLWLCNLCRLGAPESTPPCRLCPVVGGAMKPTTDGHWAHLACAIWIPETCLSDIKRMEPIDGLSRINKDRWKLLCSICGVAYGACIQVTLGSAVFPVSCTALFIQGVASAHCVVWFLTGKREKGTLPNNSEKREILEHCIPDVPDCTWLDLTHMACSNHSCRVAYHPLCARAAGLCVELEDEDRLHLIPVDEDEEEQCIRLLSFCKKHKQPSNDRPTAAERIGRSARQHSSYKPYNQSGCARCEPYDYSARRGRKAPEVLAAAAAKRLFIENRPYLVGGFSQHDSLAHIEDKGSIGSKFSSEVLNRTFNQDASQNILSMADKYKYMKETVKKRLTFGKSRIHGFGIFAKLPHKAGDMVIEYTGEIVRPSVADRREHLIYNSLVGAGTYMFRIDDERVIDATRAGSIAHLINHSCEIQQGSLPIPGKFSLELFFSIDERLSCYCGFKRCRGVVNDIEAEEQAAKLCVRRSLSLQAVLHSHSCCHPSTGEFRFHEKIPIIKCCSYEVLILRAAYVPDNLLI
ncbi:hypothetical protein Cgig2_028506 [Carnegiea gigantea]|uniref:Uncharacterized protein n=1 Tax=Carnegiea gigantea TaxID=171969 RepID=A0A9Q1GL87_9CARY|nr:hypothetical protein Cgig2_028506 [Carnegiea gigantea]